jgi:hypothetical protein
LRNYYAGSSVVVHHGGGSSRKAPSAFSTVTMRTSVESLLAASRGAAAARAYRATSAIAAVVRLSALLALSPAWIARDADRWRGAVGKWWAILRWSVGASRHGLHGGAWAGASAQFSGSGEADN